MTIEHAVPEGPRGAVDTIILPALDETKKPNIIIRTANLPVSQLWVNTHTIQCPRYFPASKRYTRMLSHFTWKQRAFGGVGVAKTKQSKLGKSSVHLKHTPFLKTAGNCTPRL